MPFTVTMPKLSPTMDSGVIAHWHKKVGDHVAAGDVLFEVSTDKATVEYEALDEGYLRKVLIAEGEEAEVNQPVAIFTETADDSIEGYQVPAPVSAQPTAKPQGPKETGEVKEIVSKTAVSGLTQPAFVPEPPLEQYSFLGQRQQIAGRVVASPLARKLAKEKELDISSVKGSGPGGRIMSRDLERAQKSASITFGPGKAPDVVPGTYEEEKLTPMRRVIGQRLQEAKTFIPHFYTHRQINAELLVALREQLSAGGVKVSINDFVVRACALALREHPNVNSGFNNVNNTTVHYKTIDICIAVSVDGGLITPIIRHADYKNLGEISVEVRALATKAKAGKLESHEYKGGSFTISNLGMYGVDDFIAVINPPQAAILAVGAVLDRPVVKQGVVVAGKVMSLTISSDHRVVDGVAAAQFLQTLKHYLENPAVLLLSS